MAVAHPQSDGRVELPKLTKKAPRVVEKGGVGQLLERARNTRLYPLILLGLATGARRGELLALQWQDVEFETGLMNVTKSLEQTKAGLRVKSTKSEKPRRFSVPAGALDALRDHQTEQDLDKDSSVQTIRIMASFSAVPMVDTTARIAQVLASLS